MRRLLNYCLILIILSGTGLSFAAENADELYRQGRFSEAEKAYAQGDMDHPKNISYRYNRGCAAYQNGDYQGASAAFSSVWRRTEDESIRHKTAYNLGNTAFKQDDFESAIQYYKTALVHDSTNEDARYNLELALREREKQKQEQQKQEQQKQDEQQQKDSSDNQQQDKQSQQDDKGDQDSSKEDQQKKQDQSESEKDQGNETNKNEQAEKDKTEKGSQDLSGELSPRQAMEGTKKDDQTSEEAKAGIDKKKAEALLDNIQEDPSRILHFQIPKEKRRGVSSGKNW